MSSHLRRSLLRSGVASLPLILFAAAAQAQVALPEIVVRAPSPIVRPGPAGPPGPVGEQSLQGTLPIVTDQFATVTVVPNEELRRNGAGTLGDLLPRQGAVPLRGHGLLHALQGPRP